MITPVVTINYELMLKNLNKLQMKCNEKNVRLRPHFKAHKTPLLSKIQQDTGAIGFTTAKLSEAELMAEEGFDDILVAYPIVTEVNAERLLKLSKRIKVSIIVDSTFSVDILSKVFQPHKLDLYIKIDTGLNRCGFKPEDDVLGLAKYILTKGNLNLKGLLTHAGHSYKSKDMEELESIGIEEGQILLEVKRRLEENGIKIKEISVGSTPTVNFVLDVKGITEVRPGNYIFNDYTQVSLGTAKISDCALTVKSTVISKSKGRVIIDAGSKTLGLDKGTHGNETLKGYGKILEYPTVEIYALSEEHGFVSGENLPDIGDVITIVPNHSCVVMNMAPFVYLNKNNNMELIYNKGKNLNY